MPNEFNNAEIWGEYLAHIGIIYNNNTIDKCDLYYLEIGSKPRGTIIYVVVVVIVVVVMKRTIYVSCGRMRMKWLRLKFCADTPVIVVVSVGKIKTNWNASSKVHEAMSRKEINSSICTIQFIYLYININVYCSNAS